MNSYSVHNSFYSTNNAVRFGALIRHTFDTLSNEFSRLASLSRLLCQCSPIQRKCFLFQRTTSASSSTVHQLILQSLTVHVSRLYKPTMWIDCSNRLCKSTMWIDCSNRLCESSEPKVVPNRETPLISDSKCLKHKSESEVSFELFWMMNSTHWIAVLFWGYLEISQTEAFVQSDP